MKTEKFNLSKKRGCGIWVDILEQIRLQLTNANRNKYKGEYIYFTTEALRELRSQTSSAIIFTGNTKINSVMGLKIFEITPTMRVSFDKYDVLIDKKRAICGGHRTETKIFDEDIVILCPKCKEK
jgi:hypothetical protein